MLETCSTVIALSDDATEITSAHALTALLLGSMASAGGEHDSL
ncbi:hypothetical protein [Salipiger bermudensis]|uniref:Uncharacterized protein n=1 Tax=Salipiger bermudensis (strain DSM 26914 / JCM 13377 / KCTC 12554 / HTCC2601) TaxID=314265 RepID=Q0FIA6_SALBH|nr:hypothetical protein [Salipiger bermudensis]EAU43910.1 hypothetical protein R2601_23865 [Salipiger bermudensis HTCC2601]